MAKPNKDELVALANEIGWFSLDDAEAAEYEQLADAVLDVLDLVDTAPLPGYARPAAREAGARTFTPRTDADDPLNAIVGWTDIASGDSGVLDGLRVAIKDSVSIAGIPLSLGSAAVQGYRPQVDSVVTDRILAAGGRIVATTNMDDFAFSGGGETSASGPIRNPHDHSRASGGSSSGSAAALAYTDRIDGAIGTDQGGSIRVPAAWCGVLGLKPTHGVVPYTDIVGIDATFDHAGPMATSVDVLGRLFLAIAGPDPSDPRQRASRPPRGSRRTSPRAAGLRPRSPLPRHRRELPRSRSLSSPGPHGPAPDRRRRRAAAGRSGPAPRWPGRDGPGRRPT